VTRATSHERRETRMQYLKIWLYCQEQAGEKGEDRKGARSRFYLLTTKTMANCGLRVLNCTLNAERCFFYLLLLPRCFLFRRLANPPACFPLWDG
jgi:hypothetical protein